MVISNAGNPLLTLFVEVDASDTGCIARIQAAVSVILRPLTTPQVFLPIIRFVFVNVVNALTGFCVHHKSMEPDKAPNAIIEVATDKITVLVTVPTVASLDKGEVFQIKKELGRLDSQDTICIEKLNPHYVLSNPA
jgi:hypothetical protein